MQRLLPRKNLVNDSSFLTREKIAAGKSEEVETEVAPPNSGDCGLHCGRSKRRDCGCDLGACDSKLQRFLADASDCIVARIERRTDCSRSCWADDRLNVRGRPG